MGDTSVRKTLTAEQRRTIEENKRLALEKLATTRKRAAEETRFNNKKLKRTPFYEYDLSTLENTKGGFIVDPVTEEKVNRFKEQATKIQPMLIYSLDPATAPKCKDCDSLNVDSVFYQVFHLCVCNDCKEKYPEKYSLITKTEAREDYLLTDPELKDKDLLPHWSKPNPRKSTWNNMMLYVREMVEEYAFKKWGGSEGLDAEYERRESQKKEKKDKKFKEKLADLRRRTMTSTWERKRQQGSHKHEFGDPEVDEQGNTVQICSGCHLAIETEEF
ncbi:XPA protein C-terminus-domain-containing protein [Chlamydoabsidia padenii]|nr:XPA protein C-terminus-domain-containing protein [Chlamydoabsidia padenii]